MGYGQWVKGYFVYALHSFHITHYYCYMSTLLLAVGLLISAIGFMGLFVPFLPDIPLISSGIIIALISRGALSVTATVAIILLTALAFLSDWLLVIYGAKKLGATTEGTIGGAIGLALSFVAMPFGFFPSLVILPAVGATIGELIGRRKDEDHLKAPVIGIGIGIFAAFAVTIKLIMIALVIGVGILALGFR